MGRALAVTVMNGLRIEVVDSTREHWATGMRVDVFELGAHARKLCTALVNADGVVDNPVLAEAITPGEYEVVFHVGQFFRQRDPEDGQRPLLDMVPFRFRVVDAQGYRLPVRVAPWGFSLAP